MFASPIKKTSFKQRAESTHNLTKNEYNQFFNAPHNIPLQESPSPRKSGSFDPISLNLFNAPYQRQSKYNSKEEFEKNFSSKKILETSKRSSSKKSLHWRSVAKINHFSHKMKENRYPKEEEEEESVRRDTVEDRWVLEDDELNEEPIEQDQPKIPFNKPPPPARRRSSYLDNFIKPPRGNNRRVSMASSKSSFRLKSENEKVFLEPDNFQKDGRLNQNRRVSQTSSSSLLDNFLLGNQKKKMKKPFSKPVLGKRKKDLFAEFINEDEEDEFLTEEYEDGENFSLHNKDEIKPVKIPQVGTKDKLRRDTSTSNSTKKNIKTFLLAIEVQRLNKILNDTDKTLVKKDNKIDKLTQEILQKEQEKASLLNKDLEVLKLELRSLAERNRQLNLKNKDLEVKNEQLRTNHRTNSLREAFENNVTSLKIALDEANCEVENLHTRNQDLQNQLDIRENEVSTLKQILQDYQEFDLSFKRKSNRISTRSGKVNSSKNVIFFINFLNDLYISMAGILRMCDKTEEKNVAKSLFDKLNELKDDETKLRSDFSDNTKRRLRKDHNCVNDTLKEIKKLAANKYHKGRRDLSMGRKKDVVKQRNEYKTKYEILLKKFNDLQKDYDLLKRREPNTVKRVNPISMVKTPNRIFQGSQLRNESRNLLRSFENHGGSFNRSQIQNQFSDFEKTMKVGLNNGGYQNNQVRGIETSFGPKQGFNGPNISSKKKLYSSGKNSVLTVSNLPQNPQSLQPKLQLPSKEHLLSFTNHNNNQKKPHISQSYLGPNTFNQVKNNNSFRANSLSESLFRTDSLKYKNSKKVESRESHISKGNNNWGVLENEEHPSDHNETISEVMITTNNSEHVLSMRLSGILN